MDGSGPVGHSSVTGSWEEGPEDHKDRKVGVRRQLCLMSRKSLGSAAPCILFAGGVEHSRQLLHNGTKQSCTKGIQTSSCVPQTTHTGFGTDNSSLLVVVVGGGGQVPKSWNLNSLEALASDQTLPHLPLGTQNEHSIPFLILWASEESLGSAVPNNERLLRNDTWDCLLHTTCAHAILK